MEFCTHVTEHTFSQRGVSVMILVMDRAKSDKNYEGLRPYTFSARTSDKSIERAESVGDTGSMVINSPRLLSWS